ncbi:MAG: helix-turn-helix transcriptional regulator [Clostridiales bacterium]|nr:helix-turn-helix transcriptional regulator [Clostridiales bacterium]
MGNIYDGAGNRIRELREINGYTREGFAEIAEISAKFLYEIETGQKGFSAETLFKIAKGLAVSSEYILTGINQNKCDGEVINTLNLFNNSQLLKVNQLLKLVYELGTRD